jgi:hypothetical protein
MMKRLSLILMALLLIPAAVQAEGSLINQNEGSSVKLYFEVETGMVRVTNHRYLVGREDEGATNFDFVSQGGQDVFYPFDRYTAGLKIREKHHVGLLYQPLEINTAVTFREDVLIDSIRFSAGTPMELKYGFPFYRVSYTYSFINNPRLTLAGGIALQVRNASIVFKAVDGSGLMVAQNVGPVPAFVFYGKYKVSEHFYMSLDATGLYASSAIINGANFDFEGSLLDASLQAGYRIRPGVDVYGNLRFLGGSSRGESQYPADKWSVTEERYGENFLGTMAFTLGIRVY